MKGKHLAILLLLVVVIGGASWFLQKGNSSSWSDTAAGPGGKILNLPLNDVTTIAFKAKEAEMNLVKKDTAWVVAERADYPASYEKVSELLRKAWDLKTVQEVKVGPSQLGRLVLLEPGKEPTDETGVLVDFKDKDGKRLDAILLGKAFTKKAEGQMAMFGDLPVGRYVRPAKEGSKVSLVMETLQDAKPDPADWLDKDFIKIAEPLSIGLAGATEAQQWKVTRESTTADWKLTDLKPGEESDKDKPLPLASAFASPSFVDVLPLNPNPADIGLDKPTVVTVENADHFVYTLKIGKLTGQNYPLSVAVTATFLKERVPGKDEKPEDKSKLDETFKTESKRLEDKLAAEKKFESRIYVVAKTTLDPILKDRSALVADKKPEPAPAAAPAAPTTAPAPVPAAPAVAPSAPPAATPPAEAPTAPAPVEPTPAPTAPAKP